MGDRDHSSAEALRNRRWSDRAHERLAEKPWRSNTARARRSAPARPCRACIALPTRGASVQPISAARWTARSRWGAQARQLATSEFDHVAEAATPSRRSRRRERTYRVYRIRSLSAGVRKSLHQTAAAIGHQRAGASISAEFARGQNRKAGSAIGAGSLGGRMQLPASGHQPHG